MTALSFAVAACLAGLAHALGWPAGVQAAAGLIGIAAVLIASEVR